MRSYNLAIVGRHQRLNEICKVWLAGNPPELTIYLPEGDMKD
jgi:hypothetical protein